MAQVDGYHICMKKNFFVRLTFLLITLAVTGAICWSISVIPARQDEILCDGETASILGNLVADWQIELDGGAMQVPTILDDNIIIIVDRHGIPYLSGPTIRDRLVGLNTNTGNIMWVFQPHDLLDNPIRDVSANGQNIAVEYQNQMVILSAKTGEILTQYPIVALEFLVTPFHLYFRDLNRATKVLSLKSGEEIWEVAPTTIDASKQFVYQDGVVYSLYGNEIRIFQDEPFESLSSIVLLQDGKPAPYPYNFAVFGEYIAVVFGNTNSTLSLYRWRGQIKELWRYDQEYIDGRWLWPPVNVDDDLFFYSKSGRLVRVSTEDGHILSSTDIPLDAKPVSAPMAYKNHIYAIYSDGTLRSFTIPEMKETIEVKNSRLKYYANESYYWHLPGVIVANDRLLASFGCKTLYAFRFSNENFVHLNPTVHR